MELSPYETVDLSMIWSVKNRISHKKMDDMFNIPSIKFYLLEVFFFALPVFEPECDFFA